MLNDDQKSMNHYHVVGVAGVGMSAIAQALVSQGYAVSGSDRDSGLEVIDKLKHLGIEILPQDGSGISAQTTGVIISTAIEDDNPDVLAARKLNVPILHRSQMLAELLKGKRCVAVTGTSGKSTVAGMIGFILEQLGADPVVVNGAPVVNWVNESSVGNIRAGKSGLWVIEADESDRSLLNFSPDWAVVTNVSADHFTLEESVKLFEDFSAKVKTGCVSILKDPDLLKGFDPKVSAEGSAFAYKGVQFKLMVPGRHNAENALFAVIMCEKLGYCLGEISDALLSFRGLKRRLELVGEAKGITVIDDYGHNPAKIRAAWESLAPHYDRVFAVWRPHGFGPLVKMMDDLLDMFTEVSSSSDKIYVLPVYDAGGTADRSINSDVLVDKLVEKGLKAFYKENYEEVINTVSSEAKAGDVVVVMGARDPGLSRLADRIKKEL